jgi:hypothetical protein
MEREQSLGALAYGVLFVGAVLAASIAWHSNAAFVFALTSAASAFFCFVSQLERFTNAAAVLMIVSWLLAVAGAVSLFVG